MVVEWRDRTVEMKSDDSSIGVSLRVTIVTPAAGAGPPRPPGAGPAAPGAPPWLHAVRRVTRTRSGRYRCMRMFVEMFSDLDSWDGERGPLKTKATPGRGLPFAPETGTQKLNASGSREFPRLEALAAEHRAPLRRTEGHRRFLVAGGT